MQNKKKWEKLVSLGIFQVFLLFSRLPRSSRQSFRELTTPCRMASRVRPGATRFAAFGE